jgi:regulatory protein
MPLPKRTNPYYVAQDILSRRDHSEFEFRTKMRRKHFSPDQIDDVVVKLKKMNLINDKKFAVMFVANTLLFKAVGPKYLSYKLKQKGIASSLIEAALAEAFPPGREAELARQAAAAWRRTHHPKNTDRIEIKKHQQRLTRLLASRGFSFSAIESAIT